MSEIKETFRHLRNTEDELFCTICKIEMGDETGIGVALCSEKDQFSRKTGRILASSRANDALTNKKSSLPIKINVPLLPNLEQMVKNPNCTIVECAEPVFHLLQHKGFSKMVPIPMKSIYATKEG